MSKFQTIIALILFPVMLAEAMPPAHPAAKPDGEVFSGTVTERMESGGYIYLNVKDGTEERWVATGSTAAKVGDTVSVPGGMEMRDFTSKTLDRTFPSIYFSGIVILDDEPAQAPGPQALPEGHPAIPSASPAAAIESLVKPEGYVSIAECLASREKFEGQSVRIRGVVTKYSPNILGSNWVRLEDGSGVAGKDTLMVTTREATETGSVVDVEGVLSFDFDLGSGYRYPVIIKDAKLSPGGTPDPDTPGDPG